MANFCTIKSLFLNTSALEIILLEKNTHPRNCILSIVTKKNRLLVKIPKADHVSDLK